MIEIALKKICRCGNLIDYSLKYCNECSKKVEEQKKERNKIYDKNIRQVRDKQYTDFYHSKEWIKIVEIVKGKYKYLDIYSYYVLGKIEYGNICHHVEELKTVVGWENRLNVEGLIYLTHSNHKCVHKQYDKGETSKKVMQNKLRELIKKFNKEFKYEIEG